MRKPDWLKVRLPHGAGYEWVKVILDRTRLGTVCQEARSPNLGECWGAGTATVMLMEEVCTQACRFCNVKRGTLPRSFPSSPSTSRASSRSWRSGIWW